MRVEWVTFDCYGTLIDWERGVYDALSPLLPAGPEPHALATRYIQIEAAVEHGAYLRYRDVLDRAGRLVLGELGHPIRADEISPLPASLPSWQPFGEVPAALRALRADGRRIAILSNVDRDLLDHSIERLGIAPDLAITAEDCGSYKPAPGHWRLFQERTGAAPDSTVHVGASLYHDIRPATALGLRAVFIDRHGDGAGDAQPIAALPDLGGLPALIRGLDT